MLVVVAEYNVKPEHVGEALDLLRVWAPMAREEGGCAAFIVNQSTEDPTKVMLYEQYRDQAAFDFHASRPEFKEIVLGKITPLLESRQRRMFEVVE